MDAACREYAAATNRPYRRTNNRVEKAREGELARCLELYAQSDLVVSSALHGCIIGVAMGRPVLAVSGDRKIEGFMQAAGLGDWVLDHAQLERLEPMIARLVHQPSAHGFVERTRAANRAVAQHIGALAAAGTALEAAR
jgi:polysaccharide pyruvyl transferase WcaK-like protein